MPRSEEDDSSSSSSSSSSDPPCCDCFSHPNHSGYLSCLDITTGAVVEGCQCKGRCPPSRCALEHCISHLSAAGEAGRTRSERAPAAAPRCSSFSSSSSSSSPSSPFSPPLSSDGRDPHPALSCSSSLQDVLDASLSYDAFMQHVYHFWPDWQPIMQAVIGAGYRENVAASDPFDFSASYALALEQHRHRGSNRRRREPDSSRTEPRRKRRGLLSGQDEQDPDQTADTDTDMPAPSASSSSSSSSSALIFSNHRTAEPEAEQRLQSGLPSLEAMKEEGSDGDPGDAPLLPALSDEAADATILAEGELRRLPDALQQHLPSPLFSALLRRGTRSDGWGCFASLLGALIGSSIAVREEEGQFFARDLQWRLRRWNASTLCRILEPVPHDLRDPALSHLSLLNAAELERQQEQIHVELQQYVVRYLAGRIMSSGLEMLCLCQIACLSSSAVTIYVLQLQPSAVIIKLPPFIPPACSRRELRAVFLLQPGFLSQNFQVVLEQATAEAADSADAGTVSFPLGHPLVLAAERWLQQQQRAQLDAGWQSRRGKQESVDEREEKRQQPQQQSPQSEIWSQLQRGVPEEKEAASWQDDARLSSSPLTGDDEENPESKSEERQQVGRRTAAAAAHSLRPRRRSEPSRPRALLAASPPPSPSAPAAPVMADGESSRPSRQTTLHLCFHDCGCNGQEGSRERLLSMTLRHHLRDLCNHSRCTTACAVWQHFDITGKAPWLNRRAEWRRAGGHGDCPPLPTKSGIISRIVTFKKRRNDGTPIRKQRTSSRRTVRKSSRRTASSSSR